MDLFFYDVDADYVKYLKATEKAKRGFTRVPDVEYENERKMVCGVVAGTDSALVYASCDFKLLEEAAKNYKTSNQN